MSPDGATVDGERAVDIGDLRQQLKTRFPRCHSFGRRRLPSVSRQTLAAGRGPWPTGVESIDALLPGGGFPGGRISELNGPRSSGKTTTALCAVSQATQAGHPVAWIDLGETFYPPSAAALGVDLRRLLIVRPGHTMGGLKAADILIRGQAFPLVILDLGLEPAKSRRGVKDPGAAFARLNGLLSSGDATLLVITNPDTAWDPIRYYATLRLKIERMAWKEILRRQALSVGVQSRQRQPRGAARAHLRLLPAPELDGRGETAPLVAVSAVQQRRGLTRASAATPLRTGTRARLHVIKNKLGAPGAQGEMNFCGWQTALLPLHPGFSAPDPST